MLKQLTIEGIARFKDKQVLSELKSRNIFFGPNGSGKTTLSSEIRNAIEGKPSDNTKAEFQDKLGAEKVITFDASRVRILFNDSSKWPGIYTTNENHENLGLYNKTVNEEIEKQEIFTKIHDEYETLKNNRDLQVTRLQDKIWELLDFKNTPHVKKLFSGISNSKSSIYEFYNQHDFDQNEQKTDRFSFAVQYNDAVSNHSKPISKITLPDLKALSNTTITELLATPIASSDSSFFTDFIKSLGNEKWVLEGQKYIPNANNCCPFCQNPLSEEIRSKFLQYFDEKYGKAIHQLEALRKYCHTLLQSIQVPDSAVIPLEKVENFRVTHIFFKEQCQNIIDAIQNKLEKPSLYIDLQIDCVFVQNLENSTNSINKWITQHNAKILDLDSFKYEMQMEFFCSLYFEFKIDLRLLELSISSLNSELLKKEKEYNIAEKQLTRIKKEKNRIFSEMSSVSDTVEKINSLLKDFGFDNFELAVNEGQKSYYLRRPTETSDSISLLSEGEKNLLGFLYFYFNVQNHLNQSALFAVCIDDPVSSTDQHGISIISHLTKRILNSVNSRKNKSKLTQVFVFAHNSYFANEVVQFSKGKYHHGKCFVINKLNDQKSNVVFVEKYPFNSVYAQLWFDVFKSDGGNWTKCNAMRRILEHYFSFLGHIDMADLKKDVAGNDNLQCSATIEALHASSHRIEEPVEVAMDDAYFDQLKNGFKAIFEAQGQKDHYDHMMRSIDLHVSPS